jgi:hypothetical protein
MAEHGPLRIDSTAQVMMGAKSFMLQIEDGTARTEGDLGVLEQLASAMIDFDRFFEILPATKGPSVATDLNDFEFGQTGGGHE